MNSDDQAVREILRAVGSLESTTKDLQKQVGMMDEKLDTVGITCNTFEIFEKEYKAHKESRKDLPERTRRLEDRVDAMEPTVDYIKSKIPLVVAIFIVIQAIIVFVWWLVKDGYEARYMIEVAVEDVISIILIVLLVVVLLLIMMGRKVGLWWAVMFLFILLLCLVPGNGDLACHYSPLVFPAQMPPAAQIISDVLSEELAWRADILNFLDNSTNLTNQTKPIIA